MRIARHISELIGNTPLVQLNSVVPEGAGFVAAKIEYLNPGGSSKDRIAIKMIDAAEASGELRPGGTIVEPTSGNTGVGLALVAQRRGYKCVFVCPDKVSEDKQNVMRAYGAEAERASAADALRTFEGDLGQQEMVLAGARRAMLLQTLKVGRVGYRSAMERNDLEQAAELKKEREAAAAGLRAICDHYGMPQAPPAAEDADAEDGAGARGWDLIRGVGRNSSARSSSARRCRGPGHDA